MRVDNRQTDLDAQFLEGQEVVDPEPCGVCWLQVGATFTRRKVWLVEAQYMRHTETILNQTGDVG